MSNRDTSWPHRRAASIFQPVERHADSRSGDRIEFVPAGLLAQPVWTGQGQTLLLAFRISSRAATPTVTRASLQADLLAAHERAARLAARVQQLEKRLSEALGEQIWRESGLGAPTDIDALHQRINQLEQRNIDLHQQLDERDDDLAAARATNREIMTRLNTQPSPITGSSPPLSTRGNRSEGGPTVISVTDRVSRAPLRSVRE
ncbi:hypothetical protein AB0E01_15585 [Nocardia vinacea]|uniref:hypothetical protein n=1 Tax=Nocardia vinacea TaxID=96468 RepID=UPI0033FA67FE